MPAAFTWFLGNQTQVSNFVQQVPFLTELSLWPRTSVLKIKKKNLWMDSGGGCLLSVDLTTLGLIEKCPWRSLKDMSEGLSINNR